MNKYGFLCFHCKDITHLNDVGLSCMTCGKDRFREANLNDVKKLSRAKWRRYKRFRKES